MEMNIKYRGMANEFWHRWRHELAKHNSERASLSASMVQASINITEIDLADLGEI